MIGLAARFAVSGGRESAVRLVLTALGVAIGVTLLLVAAAIDPAIRAQQRHVAWTHTGRDAAEVEGTNDPLRWRKSEDRVAGRPLLVLEVAATGPSSPVPLGLDHVPAPGEVHVSPALAELLEELPADRLADRFPAAPVGLIGDDHLAGPDHLVAVVGMAPDQLPPGPSALEVHRIRTAPAPFQFTDVLRVGVAVAGIGLLMPIIVFVGTSTRLGAARREQRFAALRLAGATPRQTAIVAGVEAGAAAVVGVVFGVAAFALARPSVAAVELDGHPSFLHDVAVAPAMLALIVLGVPVLAIFGAMRSLRRLQISPLGVARRAVVAVPTARRLVPFAAGATGFAASLSYAVGQDGLGPIVLLMATFALMIYGIVVAGPWLTVVVARALGRVGRRAGALLAARRLENDPVGGFRAVSGLVIAVFVASVFSGVTPSLLDENEVQNDGLLRPTTMQVDFRDELDPAVAAEALAAGLAAGADSGVILRDDPDPDRPLADPAAGRTFTVLASCRDVATMGVRGPCPAGGTAWVPVWGPATTEPAPYSEDDAADMPVDAILLATDGTAAVADRVRTAMQQVVPGSEARTGAEGDAETNARLEQLERLSTLALALTLVIAGCGLAVAVAGGIIERKRPFALLRLSGMHLGELRRVALLEATAPLLLIAVATAVAGLLTSVVLVESAATVSWQRPTGNYWLGLLGGLAAAVAVSAATLPLLGRSTAPSAVRFE